MNRASLAAGQTASNLLYLALNYYRAMADNGHGGVHGKRLNRTTDLVRPGAANAMPDFARAKRARVRRKRDAREFAAAKCGAARHDAFSGGCVPNVSRISPLFLSLSLSIAGDGEVKRSDKGNVMKHPGFNRDSRRNRIITTLCLSIQGLGRKSIGRRGF